MVDGLDDAPFEAGSVSGSFTIAGGVIRSPNLAMQATGARLFGTASLSLRNLVVGGGFAMTPVGLDDPEGLVNAATAQIAANLGGTLVEPDRTFDVSGMVDAMKAKALEVEVARLEKLRAEDEARQKAAAEERARIAAEEARKRAEEEARLKAEAEARRAAEAEAEAARRRAEQQRLQQQQSGGPADIGLGL